MLSWCSPCLLYKVGALQACCVQSKERRVLPQARAVRCAAASVAEPQVAPASADTFPTVAARQAAFTEDILPDQVSGYACALETQKFPAVLHAAHQCALRSQDNLELRVEGKLPAWLSGAFVRNGPGTFKGVRCDAGTAFSEGVLNASLVPKASGVNCISLLAQAQHCLLPAVQSCTHVGSSRLYQQLTSCVMHTGTCLMATRCL